MWDVRESVSGSMMYKSESQTKSGNENSPATVEAKRRAMAEEKAFMLKDRCKEVLIL